MYQQRQQKHTKTPFEQTGLRPVETRIHTPSSRDVVSAGLRPLWLLELFHHADLRSVDVVVPLLSSSRDIVIAGLRPLCLKSQVPERVLASNPAMSSVCIGIDNRNTHTFEQGDRECRPKASVNGLVACTGTFASK